MQTPPHDFSLKCCSDVAHFTAFCRHFPFCIAFLVLTEAGVDWSCLAHNTDLYFQLYPFFCFNGGNKNVTWQNGESCATFLGPDQSSRHINSERLEIKLKIELLFTGFQIKRVNWEELVGCERAFQNKSVWRGFVQYTTPMEKIPLTLQDMQIFFCYVFELFSLKFFDVDRCNVRKCVFIYPFPYIV